ncbi:Nmad5 family putative nucleotide modification protein [Chromobacterium sp. ASV23]|uniref:Nmad5 family putative nucleotide modification protein n=1 Tax=Chromobacterium sp. ASV23 TaxID=2795110 RepID=UPI0018EAAC65|nr:Nmad5 family putative nucleotide modification protein [Chromobacterium sp. ASV23]
MKLTSQRRFEILEALMAHTFKQKAQERLNAQVELGERIYNALIPAELYTRLKALPSHFVGSTCTVCPPCDLPKMNCPEEDRLRAILYDVDASSLLSLMRARLARVGDLSNRREPGVGVPDFYCQRLSLRECQPYWLHSTSEKRTREELEAAGHDLSWIDREVNALLDANAEFLAEFEEAWREASATLANISTIKQLLELWPDIKPFVPERVVRAGMPAPVVDAAALNARFCLPASEAAAA